MKLSRAVISCCLIACLLRCGKDDAGQRANQAGLQPGASGKTGDAGEGREAAGRRKGDGHAAEPAYQKKDNSAGKKAERRSGISRKPSGLLDKPEAELPAVR